MAQTSEDLSSLDPEEALSHLLDEARAGATDQWLAQQADLSVAQVRLWKKRHGIVVRRGAVGEAMGALQQLSRGFEPTLHRTEHNDFEAPEFVLRLALDYTQYSRLCHALHYFIGFTTEQIAAGTGTRPMDVETAMRLWMRWLSRRGEVCPTCSALIDTRFQAVCSKACHER